MKQPKVKATGSTPVPLPPGLGGTTTPTTVPKVTTPTTIPLPVPGAPLATVPTTIPPKTPVTLPAGKPGSVPLPPGLGITVPENAPSLGAAGAAIPTIITPPKYVTSPDLYEARRDLGQASIDALRAGVSPKEVEKTVSGEAQKMPGGWRGALAKVINYDIIPGEKFEFKPASLVLGPLTALDTGRRVGVGAFTESVELGRKLTGKQQVYTARDYIPVHPQTGMPIAKIGDPVITNVTKVLNTPIPDVAKITTPEQAQKATLDIAKEVSLTQAPSLSELNKQVKDITTGFGNIPYLQTGNKWVDRTIGLFGDIFLDPTTYATGPGALFKEGIETAAQQGIKRTALELAQDAAAKASTEAATVAADAAATAAQKAAAKAAADAAELAVKNAAKELSIAEKVVTKAQQQAPRRVYGAAAKETLANTVRQIREEAIQTVANKSLPEVERIAAAQAVSVLTDNVISGIATKGYANITGEAAKLLGIKGGLRIGIPTFPKFAIPGTAPFTGLIGKTVAGRRLWFVNTPKGAALLNKFMGAPEGGIIGEADVLALRTGLSKGTLKGAEAVDAVTLLAADSIYRGQLNILRKDGVAVLRGLQKENPNFRKIASKLTPYLETPEAEWAARGLKTLAGEERAVYDAIKEVTDLTFRQADDAARKFGGAGLTKLPVYFPRTQSTAALQWAGRNRRLADKVASDLGVDTLTLLSGNYLERILVPGKKWFGYTLKDTDIAGGITRLNEIAKQYGKLKFDFFTTNAGEALAGYLNNHARYLAYLTTIGRLPDNSLNAIGGYTSRGIPSFFDARYVPEDIINKITTRRASELPFSRAKRIAAETKDLRAVQAALTDVETKITSLMRPDKLVNWSPKQIEEAKNLLDELSTRLSGKVVVKQEIAQIARELENHIVNVNRAIDAGTLDPVVGGLLLDEAENLAIAVADDIGKVKTAFAGTPAERWAGVSEFAKIGFESINPGQLPNLYVRQEVASMLQNLKRLDDAKFARATEILFKDLTTFTKAFVPGSIGFHVRNALGNTFMMIGAGGRPDNLIEGLGVFRKVQQQIKEGKVIEEIIPSLTKVEQEVVRDALALSGATGFGQFAEIAGAAGAGRAGITGRGATGLTPFAGRKIPFGGGRVVPGTQVAAAEKVSAALYSPLRWLRDKGAAIEEATRFALLYDGIKQGLDPLEAANRVNKYLVDYANINAIDRNVRSIVPFWMWMSRNLPLQIENMWMAPGAYQKYLSFRRNLQDKEGESPFMPDYLREQGSFKLPFGDNLYLNPQLGFPGANSPNPLQQAASGDVYEILSGLTPALRVPIELEINKQLFSGAPITKESLSDKENTQRWRQYLYSQLLSPAGLLGRYLSAIPGDEPKWLQSITGSKLDRELNTTLSLLGSPGFKLRSIEERNEIMRRYYLLQDKKNRALQNQEEPQKQEKL